MQAEEGRLTQVKRQFRRVPALAGLLDIRCLLIRVLFHDCQLDLRPTAYIAVIDGMRELDGCLELRLHLYSSDVAAAVQQGQLAGAVNIAAVKSPGHELAKEAGEVHQRGLAGQHPSGGAGDLVVV